MATFEAYLLPSALSNGTLHVRKSTTRDVCAEHSLSESDARVR